jgi:hypothetical protein
MKLIEKIKNTPKGVYIRSILGIVLGAIAGYIYYIKIGCVSGTCPLTSNPYMSILWGAVIGYFIADLIPIKKKKPGNEKPGQLI